ncbi:hypothetical protein [Paraburkholderia fungorum]|uniref:hypothetical protein n=1 Tax=Paraburkholderia fungorum TaxID=134537 RepID=UPI0038B9CAFF
MTPNAPARITAPTDERLNTLREIVNECFGVDALTSATDRADARYVVCAENVVRALETAYDIGLIAGYRLSQASQARS